MGEATVPALVTVPATGNLTDYVAANAEQVPDRVVFRRRVGLSWEDVTARRFATEVTAVAKGIVAAGVQPGDRVGLMSRTRYEWTLFDFAIWHAGAVTVPIYETSSAEQVEWILSDSGATAVVVETPAHEATVGGVRSSLGALRCVWTLDAGAVDHLVAAGRAVPDAEVQARRATLGMDSLCTIIYTSGTTGRPKGCELTHGNLYAEVENVVAALPEVFSTEDASTLLFLPQAHVFARLIEVGCVRSRASVAHTADVRTLMADLAEIRPTFVLSVPRVFEKVYNSAEQRAEATGRGRVFRAAAATAVAYSEALDRGRPGVLLRARHALFDRLVYAKLRAALGGGVRHVISGGAPLGARLGHFFRGVGLTILEGYGLTETSAGATVNRPDALRIGTVGPPVPGTSVRIGADGEVLVKGPIVFRGYFGDPVATGEAIRDGWLHTGDIGQLDAEGFLRITGRHKEILVTAAGKNVAPAVLEDRLRASPLVSQCIVVGDAKPYVAALVTLDEEALPAWLAHKGKPTRPAAELTDDPDVRAAVQLAVDEANRAVSKAEAIKRFTILPADFSEEGGQITPSLKLKRDVVMREFAAEVEALYS